MTAATARGAPQSTGTATGLAVAGSVVTMAANFGLAWFVSQAGAATAGLFFAATAIVAIGGNSTGLGTMTGLVFFMPEALEGESPNPRSLLLIALGPVLLASAAVAAALALAAGPVADLVADDGVADLTGMLRLLAVAIPPWAATVALLGASRGLGSMTPTVAINQVFKPLGQLITIGAVVLAPGEPSVVALAGAWAAPIVAAGVLAAIAVWRQGGFVGGESGARPPVSFGRYWAYTRARSLATTFQIALERVDVILVSALAGEAPAGIYGALTRYITAGNFLIFSIAQATSPSLRRAVRTGDDIVTAQRLLHQVTGWIVALAWPYFLIVATKSEPLIELFNPDFSSGASALSILAVALLVHAMTGPIDLTLLMLGRSNASLVSTAITLAIDVVLAVVLIPRYGIEGAAIAWGAAVIAQNTISSVLVHRASGLRAPGHGAALAALGAVLAVVPVGLATPDTFGGLVITAGVAGVLYLGWLARFAHQLDAVAGIGVLNRAERRR